MGLSKATYHFPYIYGPLKSHMQTGDYTGVPSLNLTCQGS